MYYELKFSYDVDTVYTPEGESVEITREDKQECIDDFVHYLTERIKDFELNDTDFDDDNLYIRFFSDTALDDINIDKVVFGTSNNYVASTTKEIEYGEAHDYSYYEEPYYDTKEVDVEMDIYNAELTIAEEYDTEKVVEENIKDDCGDVEKGIEVFNTAMGEDINTGTINEAGYWSGRPVKYKVYYNIHNNQVLEGGSNDLREAEQFAKDCIDRLASNPWEDKHDKIDAIDSVMIYDHLQEEDVTTTNIEKYADIAVRELLAK